MERNELSINLKPAIHDYFLKSSRVIAECVEFQNEMSGLSEVIVKSFNSGGKVIFCGNGGSASDSEHLAAEFVGKFSKDRKSYPAISLTTNSAIITSVGNDYSFEDIFERQVTSLCNDNDVLIGITTSGSSKNVLNALKTGSKIGASTVLFTGAKYNQNLDLDFMFKVKSIDTCHIQEAHIAIGQCWVMLVESLLDELRV